MRPPRTRCGRCSCSRPGSIAGCERAVLTMRADGCTYELAHRARFSPVAPVRLPRQQAAIDLRDTGLGLGGRPTLVSDPVRRPTETLATLGMGDELRQRAAITLGGV